MALPLSKQELADWILRRLGAPVVNVEITDVQLEDVIDEAVQWFQEWHYDGAERVYRTIKIEGDVLLGNNRQHQGLNAETYQSKYDSEYRLGSRVMLYKDNGTPNKIWVKYDSEEHVTYVTYSINNATGQWFVFDSELANADPRFIYDSDAAGHVDSEGPYVMYDSDLHTQNIFTVSVRNDSEIFWTDSEGLKVLFDSDRHYTYIQDNSGDWVIDSEGTYVRYDSDVHSISIVKDSDGGYFVDSENELLRTQGYVAYDSDKHTIFVYDSDTAGVWALDSDGSTYVLFDPAEHDSENRFNRYTSMRVRYSIQGYRSINHYPIADGLYVLDSDSEYVLYDSEYHPSYQYTQSNTGVWVDDSDGNLVVYNDSEHGNLPASRRYSRQTVYPTRYHREFIPFVRYGRLTPTLYTRNRVIRGTRFDRSVAIENRKPYAFEDLWRVEDKVLTESVVDYDYSRVGQVGIPVPETIVGINKIFRIDNFSGIGMWNYEYQYFLNNFDFFYGSSGASTMPMTNYYIQKQYIDLIDHMMNVQPAIRFSKVRNKLYVDTNWFRLNNMAANYDYYLMAECYEVHDPEVFGDVYKDKWLKRYATALAKMQWGSNLKKYSNTSLPGGLMVDGQALYDEGKAEADTLEEELKKAQLEMDFIIG